jgi:hypothetical protein
MTGKNCSTPKSGYCPDVANKRGKRGPYGPREPKDKQESKQESKTSRMRFTSSIRGQCLMVVFPLLSIAAQSKPIAAFFDVLTVTSPMIGRRPWMR